MSMPAQKPGASKQDYATPREFLDAVERKFGPLGWDLAAVKATCVVGSGIRYFGPDHFCAWCRDALTIQWIAQVVGPDLLWLNPPFARIAPWATKCALESKRGARIALLVPASVGANWYWDHVAPYALVFALSPRLSFDGVAPYPKDLVLALYGEAPGFERWQWKGKVHE